MKNHSSGHITCKQVLDFIEDYLSGHLSDQERREFERHIDACPPCVRYLSSYRRTIELGKTAFEDARGQGPGEITEDLIKAILSARKMQGSEGG